MSRPRHLATRQLLNEYTAQIAENVVRNFAAFSHRRAAWNTSVANVKYLKSIAVLISTAWQTCGMPPNVRSAAKQFAPPFNNARQKFRPVIAAKGMGVRAFKAHSVAAEYARESGRNILPLRNRWPK